MRAAMEMSLLTTTITFSHKTHIFVIYLQYYLKTELNFKIIQNNVSRSFNSFDFKVTFNTNKTITKDKAF